ncbi:MAG TPA: NnrU family protein [Casimicrobiaceae bacterium]|nr:NnrU family protein [Casimicrobiaceae bacterium]
MVQLVAGLVVFLGIHSVRIVADPWRSARIARIGPGPWKGIYSLVSIAGFLLLIWGYGRARAATVVLWQPPLWTHYLAGVLTLVAFVLLAAAYVPGTRTKSALHHPMVLSVKVWAFAHLVANGSLADVVLFGSFLVWAIADFAASRRRDHRQGTVYPAGRLGRDALAAAIGIVAWFIFAFYLHARWIGVRPFG